MSIILKNLWHDSSARKALLVLPPVLCISVIICVLELTCAMLLEIAERLTDWCNL